MVRYLALGCILAMTGCKSPHHADLPKPHTITDELMIKIQPGDDEKISFVLEHQIQKQEKGAPDLRGRKNAFAIMVKPSVWAQVKRSATVIGYSSETECLLGDEMVNVSGMPGENFSVKIEPLAMNRFQVTGIYLASHFTEAGELGKTIPFDFVATPGEETLVYRKTVVFDPESRIGEEQLVRK